MILWGFVAVLCILWDTAVGPFVPGLRWFEPVLPMLIFFALFQSSLIGFAFGFFVALFMDLYQLASWPGMTFFSVIYLFLLTVLSRRVLTNRSFYSAYALLLFGRLIGFFIAFFSKGAIGLWDPATMLPLSLSHIFARLMTDFILLLAIFLFSSRFQRTLHSSPTAGGLVGYF